MRPRLLQIGIGQDISNDIRETFRTLSARRFGRHRQDASDDIGKTFRTIQRTTKDTIVAMRGKTWRCGGGHGDAEEDMAMRRRTWRCGGEHGDAAGDEFLLIYLIYRRGQKQDLRRASDCSCSCSIMGHVLQARAACRRRSLSGELGPMVRLHYLLVYYI
ncbi:unnamed protein product [Zymoseptoria tritici ST99CH_1A5]|uniref:Uncharacterized protein n=1 Tax=Zymoseptoria tritici ST99CH_1A5 TaxID=1276529 RepID=A0A1Y6M0Y1_ZYMTR|nr:unnamed protein product [Zymoseptoria tritici ST99CH_1A5]